MPPPAGNDVKQIGAGRWLEYGGGDVDVYLPFLCTQQRLRSFLIWYDRLYTHACTTYYNIIYVFISLCIKTFDRIKWEKIAPNIIMVPITYLNLKQHVVHNNNNCCYYNWLCMSRYLSHTYYFIPPHTSE